jgi:uncharacterized protein
MPLGTAHPIADVCMLVRDLDRAIGFYRDQLGFHLQRRDPGFAEFRAAGTTLALWEIAHVAENVGFADKGPAADHVHKVMVAVRIGDTATLDALVAELEAKGVRFLSPPRVYPWNAYCAYFQDPDDNTWELYVWMQGGPFKGERPRVG